ncbi:MAG: hypothetical protein J6X55_05655 [Victivallales bacterium]|nr:hypothetical protein [Victivallales bacterium]
MSSFSKPESVSFRDREHKSFLSRLSPRVIIYPIIVLIIVMFMAKHKELAKQAEQEQKQEKLAPLPKLDPLKPAALAPADAPLFPQRVFYHEHNLDNMEMVEKLHEKHHKSCTVIAVDISDKPTIKKKFDSQKTPFAVFSKPDGVNITFQTIMDFDFFDAMLNSMNQPQEEPSEKPADK